MGGRIKVFSEVLNREIEIPERPSRIVSISPAITETLYLLGLEDRIVGVSIYDHKPPKAREKPKVGSYFKVNMKMLEDLKPDLVLITTGAQRKVLWELAEKYPTFPIPLPVSLSGIIDSVAQIGLVTGEMEKATELEANLSRAIPELRFALSGVKAYYEIFLGGPVTTGAHTYIADAFRLMGLETPFASERTTWIYNPPAERINEFSPQYILYEYSSYAPTTPEKVKEELSTRGVELESDTKIILLEPDSLAHYGPSLFDTLRWLAREIRSQDS